MIGCKCDFQLYPVTIFEGDRVVAGTVFGTVAGRIQNSNLLGLRQKIPINAIDLVLARGVKSEMVESRRVARGNLAHFPGGLRKE